MSTNDSSDHGPWLSSDSALPRARREPRVLALLSSLLTKVQKGPSGTVILLLLLAVPLVPLVAIIVAPFAILYRLLRDLVRFLRRQLAAGRRLRVLKGIGVALLQVPFSALFLGLGLLVIALVLVTIHGLLPVASSPRLELVAANLVMWFGFLFILVIGFTGKVDSGEDPRTVDLDLDGTTAAGIRRYENSDETRHALFRNPFHLRTRQRIAGALSPTAMLFMLNCLVCAIILLATAVFHEAYVLHGSRAFSGVEGGTGLITWLRYTLDLAAHLVPFGVADILGLSLSNIEPAGPLGRVLVFVVKLALTWLVVMYTYTWIRHLASEKIRFGSSPPVRTVLPSWVTGRVFWESGVHLCEQEQYRPALERFRKAIELEPMCGSYYLSRADANLKLGELDAAAQDVAAAIELMPGEAAPLVSRGLLKFDRGCASDAFADFVAALELEPNDGDVVFWCGRAAHECGEHVAAVAHFETALAMGVARESIAAWLAMALASSGRRGEALAYLAAAEARPDSDRLNWYLMAVAYSSLTLLDETERALRRTGLDRDQILRRVAEDPRLAALVVGLRERF